MLARHLCYECSAGTGHNSFPWQELFEEAGSASQGVRGRISAR